MSVPPQQFRLVTPTTSPYAGTVKYKTDPASAGTSTQAPASSPFDSGARSIQLAMDSNNRTLERLFRNYAAACTADLTLGTTYADVTGCTATLADPGTYLAFGTFDFDMTVAATVNAVGALNVDGANQTAETTCGFLTTAATRSTQLGVWRFTVSKKNVVVKLQAKKSAASGTIAAKASHSTIIVKRLS